MKLLRIATRQSALAVWQAQAVGRLLKAHHPSVEVQLVPIVSHGDKILNLPLNKVGGKALFVKALEDALLEGWVDIAVHSMKDVPTDIPEELTVGAFLERSTALDALVSNHYKTILDLPRGAKVGTTSMRRASQLLALRPDLNFITLRGNVETRLKKLDAGKFDGIILAAAGLKRLNLEERIAQYLSADMCLPACGQGVIGIELRRDAEAVAEFIEPLNHAVTASCVAAERAVNEFLNGSCHVPIASYAVADEQGLFLRAMVASPDGSKVLHAEDRNALSAASKLGRGVAAKLIAQGAADVLAALTPS